MRYIFILTFCNFVARRLFQDFDIVIVAALNYLRNPARRFFQDFDFVIVAALHYLRKPARRFFQVEQCLLKSILEEFVSVWLSIINLIYC
jgi:hypothetical protein